MKNCGTKGIHYLINLYGCDGKDIDSIDFWKDVLISAVKESNISVLHDYFYKFEPQGVTGFLLLSSSHISIHTWPELGYVSCDVFTCSSDEETRKIISYLQSKVSHKEIEIKKMRRGFVVN